MWVRDSWAFRPFIWASKLPQVARNQKDVNSSFPLRNNTMTMTSHKWWLLLYSVSASARTSVSLNSNLSAILPPTTTAALYPCIHGPWCMAPFNHLPPLLVDIILLLISQFKLSEMLVVPIRAIATILFPFIWAIISFSRFVKLFAIQWEHDAL